MPLIPSGGLKSFKRDKKEEIKLIELILEQDEDLSKKERKGLEKQLRELKSVMDGDGEGGK